MKKSIAIFIDWENIRKTVFETVTPTLDYNYPEIIKHFVLSFVNSEEEEIFRIFLYLSEPTGKFRYQGTIYDFSNEKAYKNHEIFVKKMSVQDYFAIRKGKLKFRGFKNGKPDFVQKGVDMLMGLDIAHVSYKKIVDRILIFSGDTDIKPAMKTARINGVQVVIANCTDSIPLAEELKIHADIIREKTFYDICYEWFRKKLVEGIFQWQEKNKKEVKTGLIIKSWINNWGILKASIETINDFLKQLIHEGIIEINSTNPNNPVDGVIILKKHIL